MVGRFVTESLDKNYGEILKAVEQYLKKEKLLHTQFDILFKKHAVRDFNCSEECIDDCLNRDYATFFQVPVCLAQNELCRCSQNMFWLKKYEPKIAHDSPNQGLTVKELLNSIDRY
jgi:hypothetical protein